MTERLKFVCPDCGKKLPAVTSTDVATQVVTRTCRTPDCKARWQLVIQPLKVGEGFRLDKATIVRRRK